MPRLYIRGGIKLLKNERGSILIITAALVLLLTLLFAGLCEFGRFLIAREQTQTAADAAALAAAGSGEQKHVQIVVHTTEREYEVCDSSGCHGEDDDPYNVDRTATGTEKDLIEGGGWRDYCVPDSWSYQCNNYTLVDRWVEDDKQSSTTNAAYDFFNANLPKQAEKSVIAKIKTYMDPKANSPYYPSVVVYATSKIKSLFPGFLNAFPDSYQTTVCAQSSTYYKTVKSGNQRWEKPPADACWEDW